MTSSRPHRDPDTGEIKINGWVGAAMDWLRWVMPVIVIPLVLWAVQVQIFISKGERFTDTDAEVLKAEILKEVPPEWFKAEVSDVESIALENQRLIGQTAVEIAKIQTQLTSIDSAVQRILRDD